MIGKMREMAPTIMLIILIAFVGGTIFLDWGMNLGNSSTKKLVVGEINGKEIPLSYFDNLVNLERKRIQEQQRQDIPPEQYRLIPKQVWEREVNKRLMYELFRKMKLEASAEEVFNYMKRNPIPGIDTVSFFQTDNKFDTSKYEIFLNDPQNYEQYSWLKDIESYTAKNIIPARNFEILLSAGVFPSNTELAFQYEKKKNKVVFEYIKVTKDKFTYDSSFVEKGVSLYYESHRDSFKVEKMADLYFVKIPKKPTEADEKFYEQELLEIKSRIESSDKPLGEAFAAEATIESDDNQTASKGGDLDWFPQGAMVKEFDSIVFSMPVGTISAPVRTSYGYHLIYLEAREVKDGVLKAHARHILRKVVPTIETLDMLSERMDSLRTKMLEKGFIAAAKEEKGIILDSTGPFEKGALIPKIGYLSGAGNFAFGRTDLKVSERLENNDGFYLLAVKRIIPKGILPLAEVKEKIREKLIDSSKTLAAKAYIEKIRNTLTESSSLASYNQNDSLVKSGITDTVSGTSFIPEIGYGSPLVGAALALPEGKISSVIEEGGSFFVIKTVWKKIEEKIPVENSPELMDIGARLKNQIAQRIYYEWYLDYKNKMKIKSKVDEYYMD
ncbi:MAG: peptidylprolyl isomerase [Chitinispirillaceae bacterium]|nr:peptidylprolyl isomerase [Chitinispirillaceae bacterium]